MEVFIFLFIIYYLLIDINAQIPDLTLLLLLLL